MIHVMIFFAVIFIVGIAYLVGVDRGREAENLQRRKR